VKTQELQFKQERGTNSTREETHDLLQGSAKPQRLAYVLVVEVTTKAWSLFQLPHLLKRNTKIKLVASTSFTREIQTSWCSTTTNWELLGNL
jgi:hypothetical protein